jgi:hypothetical protein
MVDWAVAPKWLTRDEACFLSGYDHDTLQMIIDVHGVDLDNDGRIERNSLWDYLEAGVLVRHWMTN